MRTYKFLTTFIALFMLASCDVNIIVSSSTSHDSSNVSSSITTSDSSTSSSQFSSSSQTSSSSTITSTSSSSSITDSEGYVITPDDYFTNKHYIEDENKMTSYVKIPSMPDNYQEYKGFKAYVSGTKLPLYNVKVNRNHYFSPNNYNRADSAVGIIKLEGKTTVQVQCPFKISTISIKPVAANIKATIDNVYNVASFEVSSSGQYTVEINGSTEYVLHLFVDGTEDDYSSYKTNAIYFGKGIHTKDNSNYINDNNEIVLSSNQTLFIDYGAVVRAKIVSYNSTNVKVVGGGIIDGSIFDRDANANTRAIPFDFSFCSNITLKGITFLDPAGWCLNIYFCDTVTVNNVKIITSRANGDGISLQSVKNAYVDRCFVRTFDDSIVVKNYPKWSNRNEEGTTKNINVSNCLIWTDLAQSLEIGYETVGEVMEDIKFKNITVLHNFHKPVLSIHNSNNANVKNVTYENITVDDASMGKGDGYSAVIEFNSKYSSTWSNVQKTTKLGSVDNVKVTNLLVRGTSTTYPIIIEGDKESRSGYEQTEHYVSNVYLLDIKFGKKTINALNTKINKNEYTKGIYLLEPSGEEITGANLYRNLDDSQLANYGKNVSVSLI